MGLRMKNFNILGVHRKIRILRGEFMKIDIEGRGLGQFADLRGGLGKKEGG